jgi:hypothetical protein
MNRHDTQLREQRKKVLLLEGALHRLELVEARARVKADLQGKAIAGLIKPMLTVEKFLPLATSLLPLFLGKGKASGWLRCVLLIAGAGTTAYRVLRNRRQVATGKDPEEVVSK